MTFGVNDRGSNGTGNWRIDVKPDTAKLTNMIVAGFGERCNLVTEGKMFVKDEAKISSRVGGIKWRVVYFGKVVFESDKQKLSLRRVKSKKISSYPGRDVLKSVLKVKMFQSKLNGWKEKKSWVSSA